MIGHVRLDAIESVLIARAYVCPVDIDAPLCDMTAPYVAVATVTVAGDIFQAPAATPVTTLTPDTAELVITGYAPLLATTILPDAASLTITGYAPLLATTILPDAASLTVTGLAPATDPPGTRYRLLIRDKAGTPSAWSPTVKSPAAPKRINTLSVQ